MTFTAVSPGGRSRFDIGLRALTSFAGGWAWTSAATTLLARLWPGARVDATAWALVLSFGLYAAVLLWVWAEPRLSRVLAGVWGGAGLLAGAAALAGVRL